MDGFAFQVPEEMVTAAAAQARRDRQRARWFHEERDNKLVMDEGHATVQAVRMLARFVAVYLKGEPLDESVKLYLAAAQAGIEKDAIGMLEAVQSVAVERIASGAWSDDPIQHQRFACGISMTVEALCELLRDGADGIPGITPRAEEVGSTPIAALFEGDVPPTSE